MSSWSAALWLIAAGLRANAEIALGRHDAAKASLELRHSLIAEQLEELKSDADLKALALSELRLAENAVERRDPKEASRWLGEALKHADEYVEKAHADIDVSQLDTLLFAAQLNAPLSFELKPRLEKSARGAAQEAERPLEGLRDVARGLPGDGGRRVPVHVPVSVPVNVPVNVNGRVESFTYT